MDVAKWILFWFFFMEVQSAKLTKFYVDDQIQKCLHESLVWRWLILVTAASQILDILFQLNLR